LDENENRDSSFRFSKDNFPKIEFDKTPRHVISEVEVEKLEEKTGFQFD
jgi:hypothetical protein